MLIPLLQRKLISAAHICDLILSVPTLMAIGELDLLVYGQPCVYAFTTADQYDVDMLFQRVHPFARTLEGGCVVCRCVTGVCVNDWPACLFI